jgi:hypothetical protein
MAENRIRRPKGYAKDLIGQKFHLYEVVAYEGRRNNITYVICRCDCGEIRSVAAPDLLSGHSKSCGCTKAEITRKIKTKHGQAIPGSVSREYWAWSHMMKRCNNPKDAGYKNYGARGIKVHPQFADFVSFISYMGKSNGLTLERKDVNKDYEPGNVIWASHSDQARNKRNTVRVMYMGRLVVLNSAREAGAIIPHTYYVLRRAGKNAQEAFDGALRTGVDHKTLVSLIPESHFTNSPRLSQPDRTAHN